MANLTQHLTSVSPELRSGPSPGRQLLAVVSCVVLALGSVFPGVALAGEADSEGEGTAAPAEVPLVPPDFDPGGEETGLEVVPPFGGEEGGAVEAEPEVEAEAPAPEGVTAAATEASVEVAPPPPVVSPESVTSAPAPEPAASEPVANQSIVALKRRPVERSTALGSAASGEAAPPPESPPVEEEAPLSPQPVAATPADSGRNLAGKNTYVVRPGDCLWHIAADLLPGGDAEAVEREVERLWRLNEDRIGTGDPNLIYAGTELRLR